MGRPNPVASATTCRCLPAVAEGCEGRELGLLASTHCQNSFCTQHSAPSAPPPSLPMALSSFPPQSPPFPSSFSRWGTTLSPTSTSSSLVCLLSSHVLSSSPSEGLSHLPACSPYPFPYPAPPSLHSPFPPTPRAPLSTKEKGAREGPGLLGLAASSRGWPSTSDPTCSGAKSGPGHRRPSHREQPTAARASQAIRAQPGSGATARPENPPPLPL